MMIKSASFPASRLPLWSITPITRAGLMVAIMSADTLPQQLPPLEVEWPTDAVVQFAPIDDFRAILRNHSATDQALLRMRRRLLQRRQQQRAYRARHRQLFQTLQQWQQTSQSPLSPQPFPLQSSLPAVPIVVQPENNDEDVMINLFRTHLPSP